MTNIDLDNNPLRRGSTPSSTPSSSPSPSPSFGRPDFSLEDILNNSTTTGSNPPSGIPKVPAGGDYFIPAPGTANPYPPYVPTTSGGDDNGGGNNGGGNNGGGSLPGGKPPTAVDNEANQGAESAEKLGIQGLQELLDGLDNQTADIVAGDLDRIRTAQELDRISRAIEKKILIASYQEKFTNLFIQIVDARAANIWSRLKQLGSGFKY